MISLKILAMMACSSGHSPIVFFNSDNSDSEGDLGTDSVGDAADTGALPGDSAGLDDTAASAVDLSLPPFEWFDCAPIFEGGSGGQCAYITTPLHWSDPTGPTIEVAIRRFEAQGERRGRLFVIDGGPGGTGSIFSRSDFVSWYTNAGWDVLVPTHRGAGDSTPLLCPNQQNDSSDGGALIYKWI